VGYAVKTRETILGLLALALVLGGVFWVREVQRSGPSASAERPGGSREPWRARSSADADVTTPDITLADGVVDVGEVRVTLSVAPRPPVALATRLFRVRIETEGRPVAVEDGRIWFEMEMPMGEHRYALVPGADGWLEAAVVLPWCQSGQRRWYATIDVVAGGTARVARFQFDVTPPGSRPTLTTGP
jgi:hypothetical protein